MPDFAPHLQRSANTHAESASAVIDAAIDALRQLTQRDRQPSWRCCLADLPVDQALQTERWSDWAIAPLNNREHIAWSKGRQTLWLGQQIKVPLDLAGYPLEGLTLRLALTWWAELAQIFVNGELVQEGDLFDCSTRILLSAGVKKGDRFDVAIRLISPGHDDGALVRSRCLYERPNGELEPCPEPGFVADELAVLQCYLTQFEPEQLQTVAAAVEQVQWSALPDRAQFDASLITLRQQLSPFQDWLKQRSIRPVGHAHLDMAWLWPVSDTWDAAERTFRSVLQLQADFPELIFCHSTPALYDWLEQNRPELFAEIQTQIQAGRWEVVAGLWVEPEFNLVSGESIARQVLYGQKYTQEKFGKPSAIAWLPDSFGFCWQLPQIFQLGEIEYFVTQKLRWNDTTQFPHEVCRWRSPDGSEILSFTAPPIGEGIDPIKMATYACTWEAKTGQLETLWLPGVGDHGGGPSRDMLEVFRRWQRSPFFPKLEFTTALDYLNQLSQTKQPSLAPPKQQGDDSASPPVTPHATWADELYLEFHRGCYTTHADQKQQNRHCERLLYQAELFSALATLSLGAAYPHAEIEAAWKLVLFNQFHDILPGSSIPQVFVDANQDWQKAAQIGHQLLTDALGAIASHIQLPPPPHSDCQPFIVFNALNWQRCEITTVSLPQAGQNWEAAQNWGAGQNREAGQNWEVYDLEGKLLPSQPCVSDADQLLFRATVPGVGYRLFWLRPAGSPPEMAPPDFPQWQLENQQLCIRVDPQTGDLSSVFDKINQREVLSGPGNQLQAFQDQGQYWDAWNIDPNYAQHPLPPTKLLSITWIEQGPLQQRLRVVRQLGRSQFRQDYVLQDGSAVLKIETTVDWQERQVLVKAAFPLTVKSDTATYEIPYGAIQRPTQSSDPHQQAKWEVPALQWADLSSDELGVSILSDYKHGYDSQPSQLRLTLLRGSIWPNPEADRGLHHFTYALYPHSDSWEAAHTVRRGYELTQPLQARLLSSERNSHAALPAIAQWIHLSADNLVLTAFKRSEDRSCWILRCYECEGQAAKLQLQSDLELAIAQPMNLLENPNPNSGGTAQAKIGIRPWAIATFELYS